MLIIIGCKRLLLGVFVSRVRFTHRLQASVTRIRYMSHVSVIACACVSLVRLTPSVSACQFQASLLHGRRLRLLLACVRCPRYKHASLTHTHAPHGHVSRDTRTYIMYVSDTRIRFTRARHTYQLPVSIRHVRSFRMMIMVSIGCTRLVDVFGPRVRYRRYMRVSFTCTPYYTRPFHFLLPRINFKCRLHMDGRCPRLFNAFVHATCPLHASVPRTYIPVVTSN